MIRSENKTDVIIALMQKKSGYKRLQEPSHHDTCDECIQFKIFKVFIMIKKFFNFNFNFTTKNRLEKMLNLTTLKQQV